MRSVCIVLVFVFSTGAVTGGGAFYDVSRFRYGPPWELRPSKKALAGKLLVCPRRLEPAEARLDPGLQGPHRIVMGLHYEKVGDAEERYYGPAVMVRLDNDPYRVCLTTRRAFAEVEFKVADMSGRSLVIASLSERPAFVDYVRFEPVSAAAFKELERLRTAPHEKDVVGINDVNVWMWLYTSRTEQDFADIVGQHLFSGFNRTYWMANAGALFYHSDVGTRYQRDAREFTPRSGYMVEKFHPMESGVKASHAMGLEAWGWYRLNNNFASPAHLKEIGTGLNSAFFMEHPEYRLLRSNGKPASSSYSFAYPEVRAYVRAICVEMASKGVDGLMLDLLRHPPLAGYEPPLIKAYQTLHGVDPRTIRKSDKDAHRQWTAYRARHSFTQFVIELKDELERTGNTVPIGIRCSLAPFAWNRGNGMDVEDLVKRGLLREICLMNGYLSRPDLTSAPHEVAAASQPYFELCRDRGIKLICGLHGRSPSQTLEHAKFIHEAGFDGVAIYESDVWINNSLYRAAYRKLKFTQHIDAPWLSASSAVGDCLVPWRPVGQDSDEWWQISLPEADRLKKISLRFGSPTPGMPEVQTSLDGQRWTPIAASLVETQGRLNLDTDVAAKHVRLILRGETRPAPALLETRMTFAKAGRIRTGESRDGRVRISSHATGVEVVPKTVFEASVKGDPQRSNVQFYWDGALIRTEREAPFTWYTPSSLRPGLHTLRVRLAENPLAPSIDEIQVRVKGEAFAFDALPAGARRIAVQNFESMSVGAETLPSGWYFSKGYGADYAREAAKGSVRCEIAGGSKALRITWTGKGPRMHVNLDLGKPVPRGMVEFDVMAPETRHQRLAGLFEGPELNLAMYIVDRRAKMTYHSGKNSHQIFSPPVKAEAGVWHHVKWEWDTAKSRQAIYIDDMKTPLVDAPGIRKRPRKGIDRLGFFFFEGQPAEMIIDNVRAAEYVR
ncbi:MAG: hypothetical protein KAI66_20045 [Lentisphaeria bacterium]|nr:hypothetical protein [Lentisphaeria bacterium]